MEKEQLLSTVTAAQNGDNDALNTLFNEYYNDLYYFALKTVKDEETALDVTQEAFVEIINTLSNLKEPAAFVTWAKQITYHQCTRYFKKKKDVIVDEDEDGNTVFDTLQEENTEFIPDEALDQSDFKKTVMAILDELSEEQRSATMMYYFDEMSVRQIAEIQGVSEGTIKSRLNYARKAIKASVEDYEKKNGIKLHAIPFFPFFKWLFEGSFEGGMPIVSAKLVAEGVTTATGATVSVATATATTGAVVTTTTAVGIGAKIAAMPLVTKVVALIVAGVIAIGGATTAIILSQKDDNQSTVSSEKTESDASSDKNNSLTHTHQWGEWNITEQKFGVITYEIKTRECASCKEIEKVDEKADSYEFISKYFGDDFTHLDQYFWQWEFGTVETNGKFDVNALFRAGNQLVSRDDKWKDEEGKVHIPADEYYKILMQYFALDDAIISKMKSIRPESTYTFFPDYWGSRMLEHSCLHKKDNIYEIYFAHGSSGELNMPFLTVEIEYNRHKGMENRTLSIKIDDAVCYTASQRANITISLDSLIKNVTEKALDFSGYTGFSAIATQSEIGATYELLSAMDCFGYNLTKEEMLKKRWGSIDYVATNDTVNSVTATFEFPFYLDWAGYPELDGDMSMNREAAKRDIEKFVSLVGKDNVLVQITEEKVEDIKGLDSITDEVIDRIITRSLSADNICIYTAEPLTVGGKKCNLSITISGSHSLYPNAYHMSFNISFL